jgi:hypothetical protein
MKLLLHRALMRYYYDLLKFMPFNKTFKLKEANGCKNKKSYINIDVIFMAYN